jgi:RNA polymerase sigma-70 factor (ECF subfamily)
MEQDEDQLFRRSRSGDEEALRELLARYLPQLHAFVRLRAGAELRARESSMDLVQSVCRELLSAASRFEDRGEDRFRAWLFTSALNKLREKRRFHRSQKRDLAREAEPEDEEEGALAAASYLTPSVDAMGREAALALEQALGALREEHREVIAMARIARLPHAVIAETLGRSEAAVRQLLVRALLELARELRARGFELDREPLDRREGARREPDAPPRPPA